MFQKYRNVTGDSTSKVMMMFQECRNIIGDENYLGNLKRGNYQSDDDVSRIQKYYW